jgi:hypothetical protein
MELPLRDRFRGALCGLAAGDALGTALEFKEPGTFRPIDDMVGGGPFRLEPGQWTDDTSMALCRFSHRRLLDAAHIIPDSEEGGVPAVSNGLSLCKLHHAAFDNFMLGISPDYDIQIREDVLVEHDGPMLVHGLQELHGQRIQLPHRQADRPSREALAWRYERFLYH